MDLNKKIGKQIRVIRKKRKMTLKQLSEKAGLSWTYLGALERNEKPWKVNRLWDVASALGVTPGAIFDMAMNEKIVG